MKDAVDVHETLYALLSAFRIYAQTQAPDIQSFCGEALLTQMPVAHIPPYDLPVAVQMPDMANHASAATMDLVSAVINAAPHLAWRQSYTLDDPGFDAYYLQNYGWFNLIAPTGPFINKDLRVSVGYWGKGLHYPHHWHEPEEIYLTLAGSAEYISQGRASVIGGPGTTIAHYSNQPHSAKMRDAPLLAAAFWRGNGLEDKSGLQAEG